MQAMDFRSELAKWGYNKGNSIDVETLIDEILPEILSQQKRMYSEEDMLLAFETGRNFQLTGENNFKELIEQLKK
jgi:hypothetical protein